MIEGLTRVRRLLASPPLPDNLTSRQMNREIGRIVWPSLVELFLLSLASMVDMMMVGSLGPWAITAIGLTNQPWFILQAVFIALNSGATAMVARFRGMEEPHMAKATMRQGMLMSVSLSVVFSAVFYLLAEWMMVFMGAEADTLVPATNYLRIQFAAFPVLALTMTVTAVQRGVGNTRAPMVYNMVGNVVNVVFNYLLIYGHIGFPQMGVEGASLATVIGRVVALIMALCTLRRKDKYLHISRGDSFKPDFPLIGRICKIGLPAMLEQVIMRIGMLLYVRTVSSLGTVAFSVHQIVMNILQFSFMNGQAFGIAATAFIGEYLGRKRVDLAKAYVRNTRRMGMMVAIGMALAFALLGRQILSLYMLGDMSPDVPERLNIGVQLLWIVALMQPMQSSQLILNGALRGAGDTRSTAIIMFIGVLIIRPILSHWMVQILQWGLIGAWVAMAVDQAVRSVVSFILFKRGRWVFIKV